MECRTLKIMWNFNCPEYSCLPVGWLVGCSVGWSVGHGFLKVRLLHSHAPIGVFVYVCMLFLLAYIFFFSIFKSFAIGSFFFIHYNNFELSLINIINKNNLEFNGTFLWFNQSPSNSFGVVNADRILINGHKVIHKKSKQKTSALRNDRHYSASLLQYQDRWIDKVNLQKFNFTFDILMHPSFLYNFPQN